jgi:hydrogenase nickel incorporation protein HypA/HybF
LCEGIVEAAVRRAAGRQVRGLRVRIGGHRVDTAVIRQGVELAAAGTVVEGAALDLVLEPLVAHCRDCGHDAPADVAVALSACARCGGVDIEMTGSEQVVLESVTLTAAGAGTVEARA